MNKEFLEFCKNSKIEKEFNKILNNKKIKVVSFDIFDTLAFRKVSSPKDIFYNVGKKKYVKSIYDTPEAFQLYRFMAESKARNTSKYDEITFDEIYDLLDLTNSQREGIKSLEIEEENKNLYINKQIQKWIDLAIKANKKVILISDMYLSLENIENIILSKLPNKEMISKVYISCEYKETKSKRGLYKKVVEDLNINYPELFHIGDNIYSDVNIAKKLNINTLYYNIEKLPKEMVLYENFYTQTNTEKLESLRTLVSINNPYDNKKEEFYFNFGAMVMGPVLWEFSHWLKQFTKDKKINHINFIMREGKVFKKYFDKISKDVNTNLVYASRKSTYLPSLDIEKFDSSEFNFYNRRTYTLKDICNLYKIELDDTLIFYEDMKFKDIDSIKVGDELLLNIFTKFISSQLKNIKKNILEEKNKFSEYLNIKNNTLLVDFGGTGTILTQISNTIENKNIFNCLFYMHEKGYYSTVGNKTTSFIPFNKKFHNQTETFRRTPEIFEVLLNGLEKTTLGYKKIDNIVIPITEYPHDNFKELDQIIKSFEHGMDSFFSVAKDYKFKKLVKRKTLSLLLARVIDLPTPAEINYFKDLLHDDGNGSSNYEPIISDKQIEFINNIGIETFYRNFQSYKFYKKFDIRWPQGLLTLADDKFLPSILGFNKENINKKDIDSIIEIFSSNKEITKVNIYGAGKIYKDLKPYLLERNIEIISLMDSKAKIASFEFDGFIVKTLDETINKNNQYPILVASVAYSKDITNMINLYLKRNNLDILIINNTFSKEE